MWKSKNVAKSNKDFKKGEQLAKKLDREIDSLIERKDGVTDELAIAEALLVDSIDDSLETSQNKLCGDPPTIETEPCVEIFELKPPPQITIDQNYQNIQRDVDQQFGLFRWPPFELAAKGGCIRSSEPSQLNMAQKLTYHYMNPWQQNLNIIVAHSAGSGKTCTALVISSIFARAGYTPIVVTKQSLRTILF